MERIDEITQQIVIAIARLRRRSDGGASRAPDTVYHELCTSVREVEARCNEVGFSVEDTQDILYALVALADEVALASGRDLAESWLPRLLQLRYFHENTAGDGFFERLEKIRRAVSRREILRLYYVCLALGFRGRYATPGCEVELIDLLASLRATLEREGMLDGECLSPHGARPSETLTLVHRGRRLWWIPVLSLGAAFILYLALSLHLSAKTSALSAWLQSLPAL